jgi:hypothetical protein
MATSGLYVPTHASWWPDARAELINFPNGKHDDVVDALGLVGQLLDKVIGGVKPIDPITEFEDKEYRDAHDEAMAAMPSILTL